MDRCRSMTNTMTQPIWAESCVALAMIVVVLVLIGVVLVLVGGLGP